MALRLPNTQSGVIRQIALAVLAVTMMSGCSGVVNSSPSAESQQTGTIRACKWTMGEEACGKCYALETAEHGSEIADYSIVGDLAAFVDKKVKYEGTRDPKLIQSTKMCPMYFKFTKVSMAAE